MEADLSFCRLDAQTTRLLMLYLAYADVTRPTGSRNMAAPVVVVQTESGSIALNDRGRSTERSFLSVASLSDESHVSSLVTSRRRLRARTVLLRCE